MRAMAVLSNGTQYNYVLSVLDVFSRYMWLQPLSGKNSAEVLKHLKEIFREEHVFKKVQLVKMTDFITLVILGIFSFTKT